MIKNNKTAFILFIVFFLLFWNAVDYLYSAVITKSGFRFAAGFDLLAPLVVSVVIGALVFLREKKN